MKSCTKKLYFPIILTITLFAQAPLQATADSASYSWWKIGTAVVATTATFIGGYCAWHWYTKKHLPIKAKTIKEKNNFLEKATLANDTITLQSCFEGNPQADANHMINAQTPKSPFYHKDVASTHITLPALAFFLYYGNYEAVEFLLTKNANPNIVLSEEQEKALLSALDNSAHYTDYYNKPSSQGKKINPLPFFCFAQVDYAYKNNWSKKPTKYEKCFNAMFTHKGNFDYILPSRAADRVYCGTAQVLIAGKAKNLLPKQSEFFL